MSRSDPTFIGEVKAVSGGAVSIQLRDDLRSSLILVGGQSYRIGQIGAFLRIPLGYASLYGVCTLVGAAALPQNVAIDIEHGNRWLSAVLFGEALGNHFERGVSQYPTVGDEVHVVTADDLALIYGTLEAAASIDVGTISASSAIPANLNLSRLVSRHTSIVGSTGSGKSNLTAILLHSIATQGFPSARVFVIDPHGEYASAMRQYGEVFRITPETADDRQLYVPYWALPFNEFRDIALGELNTMAEQGVRDEIVALRRASADTNKMGLDPRVITADTPIPFSAKQLWFELDDFERRTLADRDTGKLADLITKGNADELTSNIYPSPNPGGKAPYRGNPLGILRHLDLLRSRIQDGRFSFLFTPGTDYTPTMNGEVAKDLHGLVASWVGHQKPITVLDISGTPSEVTSAVVGTLLRIVYDTLFWAGSLPVSGRSQPLLVVLEEAHLFLPEGGSSTAHRTVTRIAKEGRKYGIGLLVVTQRPTEIDSTILSQCGTMISLRLTNGADRARVAATMPDDLGGLAAILPSLRTGEGLVIGEALPIPSRVLFHRAVNKVEGNDPSLSVAWRLPERPDPSNYEEALRRWRAQSMSASTEEKDGNG